MARKRYIQIDNYRCGQIDRDRDRDRDIEEIDWIVPWNSFYISEFLLYRVDSGKIDR